MSKQPTLTERLVSLLDHLGLERAHFATQMPGDLAGLAGAGPDRIAGLVLAVPARLDAVPFSGLAGRLLMIAGETGISREAVTRATLRLEGATVGVLAGYDAPGWADVVADRRDEVVAQISGFLDRQAEHGTSAPAPRADAPRAGDHAGLTYRIDGAGPALILLPFFLAASQWEPGIAALSQRFSVIRLGGAHLGGVAALEDRARAPTYQAMFRTLGDLLELGPHDRILDVGCGSGALDRRLAARLGSEARIDAIDLNRFLLAEAGTLARAEGLAERIRFVEGSAEALPFADASFDRAFTITVLEECDADRAIRELVRVVRPGGRVGIVVRAIDMAQWWSFDIPEPMRARANTPPQSVGRGGVADASLYRRMRAAGLIGVTPFPALITIENTAGEEPSGPIWRYREDHVLSQLASDEAATWRTLRGAAAAAGTLFQASVLHAAVATRP